MPKRQVLLVIPERTGTRGHTVTYSEFQLFQLSYVSLDLQHVMGDVQIKF